MTVQCKIVLEYMCFVLVGYSKHCVCVCVCCVHAYMQSTGLLYASCIVSPSSSSSLLLPQYMGPD